MTQDEWKQLPMTMGRKQFLSVTGLRSSDLSRLVKEKVVTPVYLPPRTYRHGKKLRKAKKGHARYRKVDACRWVGMPL